MYDLAKNLAVQSYCFRNFKAIPALIEQLKALGVTRTELCGVHADFNKEETFESVITQFKSAGIQIASIGVQTFRGEATEEKWFKFAKAAGATMISSSFDLSKTPAIYAATEKLAEKYDIQLGIHNHGGYDWLGNANMLNHVFTQTGPRMGLCIDTAWCLQAAENPVKWAERFHDRLFGMHLKDFTFDRAGKWTDVVVGTGNLDLPAFLKIALTAPKLTAVTCEFEGNPENPGPELKGCLESIRRDVPR